MNEDIIIPTPIFFRKDNFMNKNTTNKTIIVVVDRRTLSPSLLIYLRYGRYLGNNTTKQILIIVSPRLQVLFSNNVILHSYAPEIL